MALLAGLYIFGENCGVPDLQNVAIDILIDKQGAPGRFPLRILSTVYKHTPDRASLEESISRLHRTQSCCNSLLVRRAS